MGRKSLEETSPEYRFVKAQVDRQRVALEEFKAGQAYVRASLIRWASERGLSLYAIRKAVRSGNYYALQDDIDRGERLAGYYLIERKLDEEFNEMEGVGNDWQAED